MNTRTDPITDLSYRLIYETHASGFRPGLLLPVVKFLVLAKSPGKVLGCNKTLNEIIKIKPSELLFIQLPEGAELIRGQNTCIFIIIQLCVEIYVQCAWGKVSATLRHALDMDAHARNMQ